ncbi:MAG: LysM peptidoglycan-binding domain-containing protein [Gammaproteobacteria bacterium]|nr:LysM peptidoglycan-binding domain-containing protein [Gammaproteobacteria bacterium]
MGSIDRPNRIHVVVHAALAIAGGLLLAACQTTLSTSQQAPTDQQPQQAVEAPEPCPSLSARELEREAIEMLDRGESIEARRLLDCALAENPHSRRSASLIRQLDADPIEYLGARYYWYTVQPSETLSKIAGERIGDSLEFVILARYNDIPVPANLVAGQRIKIPGDESPSAAVPVTAPPVPRVEPPPVEPPSAAAPDAEQMRSAALAQEQGGELEAAYRGLQAAREADPEQAGIDDDIARVRAALVADLEEKAYASELAGDVNEALATWEKILTIDPRNIPAQLSRSRLSR